MSDWIKVDKHLLEKPEVYQLSELLGLSREEVFVCLFRFWVWCDEHLSCPDEACNASVTLPALRHSAIDDIARHAGFTTAMVKAGWLRESDGVYSVPNFDRHLSKSAKNRSLLRERQRRFRNADRNAHALPEKKRKEKSITPYMSPKGDAVDFAEIVHRWNAEAAGHWDPPRKVRMLSEKAKTHLKARLKEFPDLMDRILEHIPCLGAFCDKPFFTFGWIIKSEDNLVKLLEGNYDDEQVQRRGVSDQAKLQAERANQAYIAHLAQQRERAHKALGQGRGDLDRPINGNSVEDIDHGSQRGLRPGQDDPGLHAAHPF